MNIANLIITLEKSGERFTKLDTVVQLAITFGIIVFLTLGAVVLPLIFGTAMIVISWLSIVAIILHTNKTRYIKVEEPGHDAQ